MRTFTYRLIGLLLIGCVLCVGCKSLRKEAESEFPESPQSNSSQPAQTSTGQEISERRMCVETARAVAAQGHALEAIKLFEKAEGLEPNAQSFDLELAPLYAQSGNMEKAVARYRNALAHDQDNTDVLNNLAWTLMESEQHDEALETIRQGLLAAPSEKRLKATQAVILHRLGDRQGSIEAFRDAYGAPAAHHNLAILDLEQGQTELAMEQASLATRFEGCSPESIALRDALSIQLAGAETERKTR